MHVKIFHYRHDHEILVSATWSVGQVFAHITNIKTLFNLIAIGCHLLSALLFYERCPLI